MKPALDDLATHQAAFRFFDSEVMIRSDSSEILARFDQIYARFRVKRPVPCAPMCQTPFGLPFAPRMACYVLAGDRSFGKPALILNGKTHLIRDPDTLFDYAHTSILNAALAQVQSHFLIHGAALSAGDAGIILAAHTGYGKTTLALELVGQGFRFLSDDIAAVACDDGRLYPFPRSLGIWPGTRQLVPSGSRFPSPFGPKREWLDIEDIYPRSLGRPCPVRYLFILTSPSEAAIPPDLRRPLTIGRYLTVDHTPAGLIAGLARIPNVETVTVLPEGRLPVIELRLAEPAFVEPAVEEICRRHQVLLFEVAHNGQGLPDFRAAPRLERLSCAQAALDLLRRLKGGRRSALLQHRYQGSGARLTMALSEWLADVPCYRLIVGPLDQMANLVCQATGPSNDDL